MRFEQQLRTFLIILKAFENDMPLARFLQKYFRQNKQMGSSDRRSASKLLYNYFRLGKACSKLPAEERLFIAHFLCSSENDPFLTHFKPELNEQVTLSLGDKITWLEKQSYGFRLHDVFPFHSHLSTGLEKQDFLSSLFIQPDLFIRLYPDKSEKVKAKLNNEGINYKSESNLTLRLPNGTKLDQIFPENNPEPGKPADALFEVQDLSSQQTGQFFQPKKQDYWWDACAASGGKSLLLYQQEQEIKLLVSDMRDSVLENLGERFFKAGLTKFQKKRLDLTQNPDPDIHNYEFDGIILDIPCSGSGTWGRTPEMISQFHESTILTFQKLQQSISANVVKYLKSGKPLIYITCSVFKEENEQTVDFIIQKLGMKLESSEVIKGYGHKADTMFVARLVKP
jgi:16S rRNA (cytosine967-C5)-methyltransferase